MNEILNEYKKIMGEKLMNSEEVKKILNSYRDVNMKNRRVCPHCKSCYFGINEVVDKLIKEIEENEKEC
jgi:hypothetical protein